MRRTKVVTAPCVVAPASPGVRDEDQHVVHGTHSRAQRNAALTACFGYYYHVHEWTVPTFYGHLCQLAAWVRRLVRP